MQVEDEPAVAARAGIMFFQGSVGSSELIVLPTRPAHFFDIFVISLDALMSLSRLSLWPSISAR